MKPTRFTAVMLVALAGAIAGTVLQASDRTGIYARVDKVVMEPNEQAPQRIQVWGVFALAEPKDPNDYRPAARGYLYYTLPPALSRAEGSNAALALKEWADLKSVAGTNQIVAFGTRWSNSPTRVRVRKADERPESPDAYAMDIGLRKINRTDYAPVRSVIEFKP
ncbi:MAG TPA: hypothetical protein VGQ16_02580 [Vicinamibacterales bacterium]|jgi:hypothetical protein|nr:hypothetical protein [Vicinamibacterales bacterium]